MDWADIKDPFHIIFEVRFIRQMWGSLCRVDDRWKCLTRDQYNSNGKSLEKALYACIGKYVRELQDKRR